MNQKITNIIEELKKLTLLEAADLVKEIEITFGVDISTNLVSANIISEVAPVIQEKIEEKTTFDIILNEVPADKKIPILKIVRNITGLGLKESKEVVDNVPKLIKEGLNKEEAESIKKDFENAGAKIILK